MKFAGIFPIEMYQLLGILEYAHARKAELNGDFADEVPSWVEGALVACPEMKGDDWLC